MSKGKSPYQKAMRKRKKMLKAGKGSIMTSLMKQFENASDEEAFEIANSIIDSVGKTDEVIVDEPSMVDRAE